MTNQTAIKKVAADYTAAWNSKSADAVASFYAENGDIIINKGDPWNGRSRVRDMAAGFYADVPDLTLTCVAPAPMPSLSGHSPAMMPQPETLSRCMGGRNGKLATVPLSTRRAVGLTQKITPVRSKANKKLGNRVKPISQNSSCTPSVRHQDLISIPTAVRAAPARYSPKAAPAP
ncbi:YybH family protein [Shimia gijangensis]